MSRIGYDSTNPADIPIDAEVVGGYVNGIYGPAHNAFGVAGWDTNSWNRFTKMSGKIEYSVYPTGEGNCGDVEPGCIWPVSEALTYVQHCRTDGRDPSIYCDAGNWPAVRQAFQAAGIPEPHYIIADWRNYPDETIPQDADARQFGGSAQTQKHYDIIVANSWPGIDLLSGSGSGQLGEILLPQEHDWLAMLAVRQAVDEGMDPSVFTTWLLSDGKTKAVDLLIPPYNPLIPGPRTTLPSLQAELDTIKNQDLATAGDVGILKTDIVQFVVPALTQLETNIKNVSGGTIDPTIAASLDVLKKHLGVGTA
jgi:hypothetical protein